MKVHLSLIPREIIDAYRLEPLADANHNVYLRLNKGMYGLPQAGILAYQLLDKRLQPYGYAPCRHTPGYWTHDKTKMRFVLVVDDFSVKYLNKKEANDFLAILCQWYTIKVDWDAKLYCGIHTDWDYSNHKVTLSMPGYINNFLAEINHRPNPNMHPTPTYPLPTAPRPNTQKPPMRSRLLTPKTRSIQPESSANFCTMLAPSIAP